MCWKKSAKIFNESFLSKWIFVVTRILVKCQNDLAMPLRLSQETINWCSSGVLMLTSPEPSYCNIKENSSGKFYPTVLWKLKSSYDSNSQKYNIVTAILISINSQQLTDWDNVFPLPLSLSRKSVQIRERENSSSSHNIAKKQNSNNYNREVSPCWVLLTRHACAASSKGRSG